MLDDSYDSDFPYPHLDDPRINDLNVRFIGQDRAQVEIKAEKPVHWSERQAMGYVAEAFEPREFGDNNKADPELNWEEK